jgi:hypothetical protein
MMRYLWKKQVERAVPLYPERKSNLHAMALARPLQGAFRASEQQKVLRLPGGVRSTAVSFCLCHSRVKEWFGARAIKLLPLLENKHQGVTLSDDEHLRLRKH